MVCDLIRGGSEGQCARTAMGLQSQGVDCRVAVFFRQGYFLDAVETSCGPVLTVSHASRSPSENPPPQSNRPFAGIIRQLRGLPDFIRWVREEQVDLIHTWDAEASVWGSIAARRAGIPLITSRRDLGQIYPRWKGFMLNQADRQAQAVVANALAVAEHFRSRRLPQEKIRVIGNILDLEEFDELRTAKKPISPHVGGCRIICVSRLDPEKDHETLLKAFALLLQSFNKHPAPELHLVGSGSQGPALEHLARELQIEKKLHVHGERSDIPALLQEMDIGILTPKANEGLSNTLLEYMASSLPIVATDCGGNRELVEQADAGRIVPIGDPDRCSQALQELIADPCLRRKEGMNGRHYLEKNHSPAVILSKFTKLYQDVLSTV